MKKLLLLILTTFSFGTLSAQMPHDAIYMPKKTVCVAVVASNNSWNQYWENTLKRENLNIGTHSTRSMMAMAAVGVSKNLNVIVALPWVATQTSAGNLMGQRGLQDFSAWAKYKMIDKKGLSLHAAAGASTPVSNYVPDFLPMSIGLQSRTASGRLIGNYQHKTGLYLGAQGTYSARGNIAIDRDAYQAYGRVINSNQVAVPNAVEVAARVGFLKSKYQAEVFGERFSCVGGDNIRRNDMPFPTNKMQNVSVGGYVKFQPKNIGFNASYRKVLSGLNVGQTSGYSLGILYQINQK